MPLSPDPIRPYVQYRWPDILKSSHSDINTLTLSTKYEYAISLPSPTSCTVLIVWYQSSVYMPFPCPPCSQMLDSHFDISTISLYCLYVILLSPRLHVHYLNMISHSDIILALYIMQFTYAPFLIYSKVWYHSSHTVLWTVYIINLCPIPHVKPELWFWFQHCICPSLVPQTSCMVQNW